MAFATSNGAFLGLDMAFLALLVIGHAQSGLTALRLQRVTLGAGLTFGTLALNFFSIFIYVVTNGAVFGLGLLIVNVMVKSADRTFQFSESISFQIGITLGKSRNTAKRDKEHDRAEYNVSV